MRKVYKKLSVVLSIIMLLCLFTPCVVSADTLDLGSSGIEGDGDQALTTETNVAPVVTDKSYTTNVGTTLIVEADEGVLKDASDVNGDTLTAIVVVSTVNGALSPADDGSFAYFPEDGFVGTDTFTFVANDGELNSEQATVTINVVSVNTAPDVINQYYTTSRNTVLTVDAATGVLNGATDADGDVLSVETEITYGPYYGSVVLNSDGSFTYTPDEDFVGEDYFEFSVTDDIACVSAVAYIKVGIPDVEIAKTVDKSNAYAGESVKYTITVTNTGDTTLHDIIVYDDLADKSWMPANLDPSSSSVITLNYTIPADKQVGDTITNTATVYANEYYDIAYRLFSEDMESNILEEYEGNIAIEYGIDNFDLATSAAAIVTVIKRKKQSNSSGRSSDDKTYTLRTAVEGEGTVSPGPGASEQTRGSTVQLSAVPADGWKFDGWQGDDVNENNQIRMDGNKSVTAVFSKIPEEIEEESTPQAPVTEPQDNEIEEEVPAAPVEELPKTGGVPAGVFYGLGGLIAAAGAIIRRRTKM